jgi:ATP-dependent exoDNAse (exonuclease V) beta subunit
VESTKELQQLAKFSSGTFPVVSVHVRLPWADQPQPAEGAAFLARHLRQARALPLESEAARQSLKHDLARLEQWREALRSDTSQVTAVSVALFACSRAEVWVEFPSPIPFENLKTSLQSGTARLYGNWPDSMPIIPTPWWC